MTTTKYHGLLLAFAGLVLSCAPEGVDPADDTSTASQALWGLRYGEGYNVHLEDTIRFNPIQAGSDATHGRELFGISADLRTPDPSWALFEGFSIAAGRSIASNGRTCFTCHRGLDTSFGLPPPPLSASIPATDPLFTGMNADIQGDPDGAYNLENLGLIKYRPNRFNPARPQSDPFRQVFFWRKSPPLINVTFNHGFLLDGRGRTMLEADRGAVFSHTQPDDDRFDDLFSGQAARDLEAFQFSLVSDPLLLALRDESHPMHDALVEYPFLTVPVQTWAQLRGKWVFRRDCMSCHNTPNVFNNRANVEVLGADGERPEFPTFAPHVGRSFDIGVSARNKHNLRFTRHLGNGTFAPIIIPLANEDGSINMHEVTTDIGLAATTRRTVDIGRFKVPQLRNIKDLGPYFHDNSADTLEEVIDYFNSDHYNLSDDGRRFPICMTDQEKADLLEFLLIL